MARKSQRLVHHTAASRIDLISVYLYNTTGYGESHADMYMNFLNATMDDIAEDPKRGQEIKDFPGVRVFLAKSRPRKSAFGYRIFYREVEDGIEVIRVLHSRMDWPKAL